MPHRVIFAIVVRRQSASQTAKHTPTNHGQNCGRTCSPEISDSAIFINTISRPNCLDQFKANLSIGGSRNSGYSLSPTIYSSSKLNSSSSSSASGNQGMGVLISIKPKSPTTVNTLVCPDLIPISSDDESLVPKLQECTSSSLAASGLPTRDGSSVISDPDGNFSSSSNSSRASSRRKKQTTFYGSPIRRSVNVIHTQSTSTSTSTPVSPDKKVRFVVANPDLVGQAGKSRVVLPNESEDLCRKFTRFFPKKSSTDHPLRRSDK